MCRGGVQYHIAMPDLRSACAIFQGVAHALQLDVMDRVARSVFGGIGRALFHTAPHHRLSESLFYW